MSEYEETSAKVLAVYPMWRGFGFAVIEGRTMLVRWGIARLYTKGDNEFVERLAEFVDRFGVTALVLEDVAMTRRRTLAQRRIQLAGEYARVREILVVEISRARLVGHFGQDRYYGVATMIAEAYPELAPHLPHRRRPWDSEDPRMCLFKTVALAVVGAVAA